MEELLIVILQFLFEFVMNVLANLPFDWPSRTRKVPEPSAITLLCLLWFAGGCLLAWTSLLVVRHTLIAIPELRVANLLLAPVASAYLSRAIAERRSGLNPNIVPRNHFWQAFWFTLGLVLVRFAYATR